VLSTDVEDTEDTLLGLELIASESVIKAADADNGRFELVNNVVANCDARGVLLKIIWEVLMIDP
jgi:hypothetical protein